MLKDDRSLLDKIAECFANCEGSAPITDKHRAWAGVVLALIPDYPKYRAFWDQARMIDRQNFEEYEWPKKKEKP